MAEGATRTIRGEPSLERARALVRVLMTSPERTAHQMVTLRELDAELAALENVGRDAGSPAGHNAEGVGRPAPQQSDVCVCAKDGCRHE